MRLIFADVEKLCSIFIHEYREVLFQNHFQDLNENLIKLQSESFAFDSCEWLIDDINEDHSFKVQIFAVSYENLKISKFELVAIDFYVFILFGVDRLSEEN